MAEKEKKSTKALLVNTKVALAKAEKELITAKKNKKMIDGNMMKIITINYEVAKNNLKIAKQLTGETKLKSAKPRRSASQPLATQAATITSSTQPVAASATNAAVSPVKGGTSNTASTAAVSSSASTNSRVASHAAKVVTMTRRQYREELKRHHKA